MVPYRSMCARAAIAVSWAGHDVARGRLELNVPRRTLGVGPGAAQALPGSSVQRSVADDAVGHPGAHGERRLADDRHGDAATQELVEVEVQVLHPEGRSQEVRADRVVRPERGESVDVVDLEAGVLDSCLHRSGGKSKHADSRILGELGATDARDGCLRAGELPHTSCRSSVSSQSLRRFYVAINEACRAEVTEGPTRRGREIVGSAPQIPGVQRAKVYPPLTG